MEKMKRPSAKLHIKNGDIKDFLEGEKKQFNRLFNCWDMLKPVMRPVLMSVIFDLEDALQNPETAELSTVPLIMDSDICFEINASYNLIPQNNGYIVEVYAQELEDKVIEIMKHRLEKYGFEVTNYM